ncbi:MAG: MAE_28990/MAE_18760 family HEPN-like nuclease [Prosthecobacter sp.]
MSKPFTANDLSFQLDSELTWRRKELSDLKSAIRNADPIARNVLLRSLVTMSYAHWEGYVRVSAMKYFTHITLKKKSYRELDRQFYTNSFMARLDAFYRSKSSTKDACAFIISILDSLDSRFAFINPQLIDTKSNLNTDVINDLCLVCGFDGTFFESSRFFIDATLLKKRNAIAHGQEDGIDERDVDEFVNTTLSLLEHFRTLIENKVYTKSYLATT